MHQEEIAVSPATSLVVAYFEGLLGEIDTRCDLLIHENCRDLELVARIDQVRDEYAQEVTECMGQSVRRASGLLQGTEDRVLLFDTAFCFTVNIERESRRGQCEDTVGLMGFRLVVVDAYLSRAQISCFEEILKFTPAFYYEIKEKAKEALFVLRSEAILFFKKKMSTLWLFSFFKSN
jgi:hypothetical protein